MAQKTFKRNKRTGIEVTEPELIWSEPGYEVYCVCAKDVDDFGTIAELTQRTRRYLNERRPKGAPPFGVTVAVFGRAPILQNGSG